MEYFLCVLGMVFVIEALPYIAFPGGLKKLAREIDAIPEHVLRIVGLIAAFAGLAIIYLGRSMGGM